MEGKLAVLARLAPASESCRTGGEEVPPALAAGLPPGFREVTVRY
jgi:hypothetical protein